MNYILKQFGINNLMYISHDSKVYPLQYNDHTTSMSEMNVSLMSDPDHHVISITEDLPSINIHRIRALDTDAIYKSIVYDSYEEFQYLCNAFKKDIPIIVNNSKLEKLDHSVSIDTIFDRKPYYYFEHYIELALNNLSKYKNPQWSKHMTYILVNMIRGLNVTIDASQNGIYSPDNDEEMGILNPECTSNGILQNKKMYNDIIINVILNVIVNTESNGDSKGGAINKIATFECSECTKTARYVKNNLCSECHELCKYYECVNNIDYV